MRPSEGQIPSILLFHHSWGKVLVCIWGVAFQLVRREEGEGEGEPFPLDCTSLKVHASPAHIPPTRMFLMGGEDGDFSLIKASSVPS